MTAPATKPQQKPKPYVILSVGGAWAQLLDQSLSRKLVGMEHIRLGDPQYRFPPELFQHYCNSVKMTQQSAKELFERLSARTIQSSELVFRFQWFIAFSSIVMIDSKMLDTAIGQYVLCEAKRFGRPAYGVATDTKASPLSAAFLKATLYPESPDDLVKVCLEHHRELLEKQATTD